MYANDDSGIRNALKTKEISVRRQKKKEWMFRIFSLKDKYKQGDLRQF